MPTYRYTIIPAADIPLLIRRGFYKAYQQVADDYDISPNVTFFVDCTTKEDTDFETDTALAGRCIRDNRKIKLNAKRGSFEKFLHTFFHEVQHLVHHDILEERDLSQLTVDQMKEVLHMLESDADNMANLQVKNFKNEYPNIFKDANREMRKWYHEDQEMRIFNASQFERPTDFLESESRAREYFNRNK
jgi:hypothetical protein